LEWEKLATPAPQIFIKAIDYIDICHYSMEPYDLDNGSDIPRAMGDSGLYSSDRLFPDGD
jgi:hypothetical protein